MEAIVAGAIFLLSIVYPIDKQDPKSVGELTSSTPQKVSIENKSSTPTPTPNAKQPIIYNVQSGDSLESISKKYYGAGKFWTTIWNDNDWIEDPTLINNGWELKIREKKPTEIENLNEKLLTIYEEITKPTPTPTPENDKLEVLGVSANNQAPTGSFDQVYKEAGSKYGVPWEILYGLHFMETGLRDGAIMSGYGTGAQGPLQFMPSTWAIYGADGNGDGVNDINNAVDAIHGAANYIAKHGGVEQGLKSYGGDIQKTLNAARSRGYAQ